jgi:hypothetical protein
VEIFLNELSIRMNYVLKHKDKPGWNEWVTELNNDKKRQSFHAISEIAIAHKLETHGWNLARFKNPEKYRENEHDIDLVMEKSGMYLNIQVKNPEGKSETQRAKVKKSLWPILKKKYAGFSLFLYLDIDFDSKKINDVFQELKLAHDLPFIFSGGGLKIVKLGEFPSKDIMTVETGSGGGIALRIIDKVKEGSKQLPKKVSENEYNVCAIVLPLSNPQFIIDEKKLARSNIDFVLVYYNNKLEVIKVSNRSRSITLL